MLSDKPDMSNSNASAPARLAADATDVVCPRCHKPLVLCVCDSVEPIQNRVALLVLQHPQEQDRLLGSARLATLQLENSVFRIGLSWPSLSKALGEEADPGQWAVLHLGSTTGVDLPRDREVVVLDRKGAPMDDQDRALKGIRGVIVFDGTWSQAKTLWWRNAWVLKTRRLVLNPREPSLYGKLRREPKREGLSTIEAAGLALSHIERRPEIEASLRSSFRRMLTHYRTALAAGELRAFSDGASAEAAAKGAPAPRRDWRKRNVPGGKIAAKSAPRRPAPK
jgi:DTW domain-containing protein YfiP